MKNEKELITQAQGDTAEESEKADPGKEGTVGQNPVEPSAVPTPGEPADLADVQQKWVAEKQELYERLLRKQAELENLRKRLQREKEDFVRHATADLVRALLPILDGFERALKHSDSNVPEQFFQGIELIYRELLEVLRRAGLTPIETAGKLFDPHLHQAVETVEVPGFRDQEIVEELQRGYKLKHRLLRPAIVKVAVASRAEDGSHESPQEPS